jgi:hypothetical protein
MSDDETPIAIDELETLAPEWARLFPPHKTYRLIKGQPNDGRPPLKAIRIGRRVYVTRRAMREFLAAREV